MIVLVEVDFYGGQWSCYFFWPFVPTFFLCALEQWVITFPDLFEACVNCAMSLYCLTLAPLLSIPQQHLRRSPNEPVYAQVNREKKKLRQYDDVRAYQGTGNEAWEYERQQQQQHLLLDNQEEGQQGGDSWVWWPVDVCSKSGFFFLTSTSNCQMNVDLWFHKLMWRVGR